MQDDATRWWLGVLVVFVGLCIVAREVTSYRDAARYDFRAVGSNGALIMRIDQFTGQAQAGSWMKEDDLRWHSIDDMKTLRELERDFQSPVPGENLSPAPTDSRK